MGANQSLKMVADNFEVIPEIRNGNGKSLLYIADQIKSAGFYDLKILKKTWINRQNLKSFTINSQQKNIMVGNILLSVLTESYTFPLEHLVISVNRKIKFLMLSREWIPMEPIWK